MFVYYLLFTTSSRREPRLDALVSFSFSRAVYHFFSPMPTWYRRLFLRLIPPSIPSLLPLSVQKGIVWLSIDQWRIREKR